MTKEQESSTPLLPVYTIRCPFLHSYFEMGFTGYCTQRQVSTEVTSLRGFCTTMLFIAGICRDLSMSDNVWLRSSPDVTNYFY
ncbi:hypothetical protein DPMN_141356 [Dreissena polymorpha]|uniref:Uncharacterized protein n=1 Tax=Dreissena polymorpha TaxID=45954 RepID=A0A9D4JL70_DREPO|nr:hypothetical protein DPMN_141356 [Dreissena polymorpha]